MSLWTTIKESWNNGDTSYRQDVISGDSDDHSTHVHSWYEVGKNGVNEGSVTTTINPDGSKTHT